MVVPDGGRRVGPQPLLELCLESLAEHIDRVSNLNGLAEELAVALFGKIMHRSKLTPRVLRMLRELRHEGVEALARRLGVRDDVLPPVLPTSCMAATRPKW